MKRNFLLKNEIEELEIDLTGTCNLSCYICSRNFIHAQYSIKKNIRPLDVIIKQIDEFAGLKRFVCAGTMSEPTLYPQFFQLVEYLNRRNLKYEIFTNGNTHDEKWWSNLGKLINKKSRVVFTICGSTQELHEKYRVGSNLQQILDHAKAFKQNGKKNDWCQHILFEYNREDYNTKMAKILNQFSHSYQVHSEGRRRLNEKINSCPEGVCPIKKIESAQNFIFSRIKELNSKEVVIDCESYRNKKLYINQFGKISYCFTHAEFEDDYLNDMNKIDYKKIKEYNYYDCFLCSKESRMYMNKLKFNFIC